MHIKQAIIGWLFEKTKPEDKGNQITGDLERSLRLKIKRLETVGVEQAEIISNMRSRIDLLKITEANNRNTITWQNEKIKDKNGIIRGFDDAEDMFQSAVARKDGDIRALNVEKRYLTETNSHLREEVYDFERKIKQFKSKMDVPVKDHKLAAGEMVNGVLSKFPDNMDFCTQFFTDLVSRKYSVDIKSSRVGRELKLISEDSSSNLTRIHRGLYVKGEIIE